MTAIVFTILQWCHLLAFPHLDSLTLLSPLVLDPDYLLLLLFEDVLLSLPSELLMLDLSYVAHPSRVERGPKEGCCVWVFFLVFFFFFFTNNIISKVYIPFNKCYHWVDHLISLSITVQRLTVFFFFFFFFFVLFIKK